MKRESRRARGVSGGKQSMERKKKPLERERKRETERDVKRHGLQARLE